MRRTAERGFTLIEVVVATALTVFVIVALAGGVAGATHASAMARVRARLRIDARNVLTDLRAVTAYDPTVLQRMVGRSADLDLPFDATSPEHVSVRVFSEPQRLATVPGQSGAGARTVDVAEVHATAFGENVTERLSLTGEAPAPGSSVDQ